MSFTPLRLSLACALLALGQAAEAAPLDFGEAVQRARQESGNLQAARLTLEARQEEAQATRALNLPQVNATLSWVKLEKELNADISAVSDPANRLLALIGAATHKPVPSLPSTISYTYENEGWRPMVSAHWALYTGGRITAAQHFADARAAEASSGVRQAEAGLATTVAQRYFNLQMARRVLVVRNDVSDALAQHLHQAERMEAQGLIARAERLHATVARDEAERERVRARGDAELAQSALQRTLNTDEALQPTTPLFVLDAPIEPLRGFVDSGLARFPGLGTLAAKRDQASQAITAAQARYLPEVFAFGEYQFNKDALTPVEPDWLFGVGVRFTLFDNHDRGRLLSAARKEVESVDAHDEQIRRDLSLLIERNWRRVEQARERFGLLESGVGLAQESLRLRSTAFREGLATSLDVVDARLALARAETERAAVAFEYDTALAELLEASGQPERFAEYAGRPATRIATPVTPLISSSLSTPSSSGAQ